MPLNATLVEINVYDGMTPLASGYLQSYASRDPEVRKEWGFRKLSISRKTPIPEILDAIVASDSDLYAFSCYVWNMGHVNALIPAVRECRPDATILIGGPQVMQHADRYLDPGDPRMLACNGEGEKTFAGVLQEFMSGRPDYSSVNGLSFYRDKELVTTPPEPRIQSLDEIPSPFLTGIFDEDYRMSVIETNRGCPFRCGFCYWGAANNDRVFRMDEDRVRDEITWLSEHEVPVMHIADANWGMLKRDIGLSRHIAECKAQSFFPLAVIFASAKNSPARVAEITKIFTDAGLVNTQPISIQSMDETSLDYIDRKNVKLGAYAELQEDLNSRGIGSYIELIWPLPGETLATFKAGIETLCENRAATIIVYAHLLLHNTPMYRNREKFKLKTLPAYDSAAEAELVTQTAQVDYEDFKKGIWFIYAVKALHNTHHTHALSSYLHATGAMSFSDFFTEFAAFAAQKPDHPFSAFCLQSIEEVRYYDFTNYPAVYHMVLHGERAAFESLFFEFARSQDWWADDRARFLYEVDLVAKPYLYGNTDFRRPAHDFELVRIVDMEPESRTCVIEVPAEYQRLLHDHWHREEIRLAADGSGRLRVDHKKVPYPYNPRKSEEDRADYCSGMITRVASILPSFTAATA